jgi:uncharacterized protein YkwD
MRVVRTLAWAASLLAACGPRSTAAPPASGQTPQAAGPTATQPSTATPGKTLSAEQARRYMVELINRDRASAGLAPVAFEDGAAARAGQAHAEDMAARGYLGHWGTDGSVPEQRFTEAGGVDMVLENASCYVDERRRAIDPAPRIEARYVEEAEKLFFDEKPPNDGHRRNILTARHNRVGIGVAQPRPLPNEVPSPCFAQEFVDAYGSYAPTPRQMRPGAPLHVEGTVSAPAMFAGVGVARVDAPKPIDVTELNGRHSYQIPPPSQSYWPAGYKTPIPVQTTGSRFSIDVPLGEAGKPGMYEVSVWATLPGSRELVMVSLRTIQAR